ncbi:hypothetical protein CLU79DRAFT_731643 [Phycomyces nitens]|nr:hypothetical protein CLU79DRAFT_731643 [Phycomyces nitens]
MIRLLYWLVLLVLVFNVKADPVIPAPRSMQGCVLIQKEIYCYGGFSASLNAPYATPYTDHFALNVSDAFSVTASLMNWRAIPPTPGFELENVYSMRANAIIPQNSYIVNGCGKDANSPLVNTTIIFNINTQQWSSVTDGLSGNISDASSVSLNNGTIKMWGGARLDNSSTPVRNWYKNFSWGQSWINIPSAAPSYIYPRAGLVSVLSLDGTTIYYLGGIKYFKQSTTTNGYDQKFAPMSELLSFNTSASTWSVDPILGDVLPSVRHSFTLNTVPNTNTVFMYGGESYEPSTPIVDDYSWVLDLSSLTWSQKTLPNSPGCLRGHSAISVNNYLFVLFGNDNSLTSQNNFHVLNFGTWEWTDDYSPSWDLPQNKKGQAGSSGLSTGAIVGIAIGAAVAVIAALLVLFFLRRRKNKKQLEPVHTETTTIEHTEKPQSYEPTKQYANSGQYEKVPMGYESSDHKSQSPHSFENNSSGTRIVQQYNQDSTKHSAPDSTKPDYINRFGSPNNVIMLQPVKPDLEG